jgi:hypothetical protein
MQNNLASLDPTALDLAYVEHQTNALQTGQKIKDNGMVKVTTVQRSFQTVRK